jgi:hypothetical protein
MMDVETKEIISAVASHNIRWIKKNFYTNKFKEKLSVNILLAELSEFYTAQDEKVMFPSSLIEFFYEHYANNPKKIEELKEKLVKEFIDDKRILFLHENLNSKSIDKIQKVLFGTSTEISAFDVFELSAEPEDLVKFLEANSKFNFAILCLTKLIDKFTTISLLMFLIGYFGAENICVIYNNEDAEISKIAKKLGISYDSYIGLGLSVMDGR